MYDIAISTDPDDLEDPYERGLTEAFYVFNAQHEYTYYWTVYARDGHEGFTGANSIWSFYVGENGIVNLEENPVPDKFAIASAYPNPFNPTLNISLAVPERSDISVTVFDMLGR